LNGCVLRNASLRKTSSDQRNVATDSSQVLDDGTVAVRAAA
jgi:hypothetical protein